MLIPNVLCCLILWDTSYKCLLWQKPILWHIFPYIYGTILDRKYSKSWNSVHNVFLNIYHTVFKRKKFLHLHCQSTIGVHTAYGIYKISIYWISYTIWIPCYLRTYCSLKIDYMSFASKSGEEYIWYSLLCNSSHFIWKLETIFIYILFFTKWWIYPKMLHC